MVQMGLIHSRSQPASCAAECCHLLPGESPPLTKLARARLVVGEVLLWLMPSLIPLSVGYQGLYLQRTHLVHLHLPTSVGSVGVLTLPLLTVKCPHGCPQ